MVFVIRVDDANDDALTTASDHIDDVSDTASAALSALKDAETGQRGFLITGKESYLGPYDAGLRDFDTAMAKLRQLSAAEPELSALISHMADVGAKKRAELSVTIDLFRAKGQAAAFEHVSTGIGKQYMDEIRETAGTVVSVEDAAYDRDRRAAAQAETATHWKSLASVVVLFLLTLMGTLLLSMEIRYERRLAANLEVSEKRYRELAESLEDQVEARTRELQQLNQELTAFSYSVSHDLRAPLRSIDGFSQIVIEDYADKLDDNGRAYAGAHPRRRAAHGSSDPEPARPGACHASGDRPAIGFDQRSRSRGDPPSGSPFAGAKSRRIDCAGTYGRRRPASVARCDGQSAGERVEIHIEDRVAAD